jgi:hypothetical protein
LIVTGADPSTSANAMFSQLSSIDIASVASNIDIASVASCSTQTVRKASCLSAASCPSSEASCPQHKASCLSAASCPQSKASCPSSEASCPQHKASCLSVASCPQSQASCLPNLSPISILNDTLLHASLTDVAHDPVVSNVMAIMSTNVMAPTSDVNVSNVHLMAIQLPSSTSTLCDSSTSLLQFNGLELNSTI